MSSWMAARRLTGSIEGFPPHHDNSLYAPGKLRTFPLKKGDEIQPEGSLSRGRASARGLEGGKVLIQRADITCQRLLQPPGIPRFHCPLQGLRNFPKKLSQDHPRIPNLVDQLPCTQGASGRRNDGKTTKDHREAQAHRGDHSLRVAFHSGLARPQSLSNQGSHAQGQGRHHAPSPSALPEGNSIAMQAELEVLPRLVHPSPPPSR